MWNLFRNPMLARVGLEGTDTVQGLKTIDRLRAAQLLDHDAASSRTPKTKPASGRSYRRYKVRLIIIRVFSDSPRLTLAP